MEKEIEGLNSSVEKLTAEMEKANSLRRNFLRGIVLGVGSAIGASVIAAIIITIATKILHTVKDLPAILK